MLQRPFCFLLDEAFLFPKKGGKAIAVSFGTLMGLYPYWGAVILLSFFYVFFSVIFVITPHLYRSIVTYSCFCFTCIHEIAQNGIRFGCVAISLIVILKHCVKYHGEKMKIFLLGRERSQRHGRQKIGM